MRLVLVSFAVMALAFYELSGGSDFEPPKAPVVAESPIAPKPAEAYRATKVAAKASVKSESLPKAEPAVLTTARNDEGKTVAPSAQLNEVRASLSKGLTLVSMDTTTTGFGATANGTVRQAAYYENSAADIREVTGTRVNMRDGPGTTYPVIGRATLGQKVEVLNDSGNGWLRLRTVSGQQTGWISASLISKR